jgi:hypothetical protein
VCGVVLVQTDRESRRFMLHDVTLIRFLLYVLSTARLVAQLCTGYLGFGTNYCRATELGKLEMALFAEVDVIVPGVEGPVTSDEECEYTRTTVGDWSMRLGFEGWVSEETWAG